MEEETQLLGSWALSSVVAYGPEYLFLPIFPLASFRPNFNNNFFISYKIDFFFWTQLLFLVTFQSKLVDPIKSALQCQIEYTKVAQWINGN